VPVLLARGRTHGAVQVTRREERAVSLPPNSIGPREAPEYRGGSSRAGQRELNELADVRDNERPEGWEPPALPD